MDLYAEKIRAVAHKDREAFSALFLHYAPRVKAYAQRRGLSGEVAEDIAQDAMVAVWRKAAQFDPARGTAAAWIFRITRNRIIDHIRGEKHPSALDDAVEALPDEHRSPEEVCVTNDSLSHLAEALRQLPAQQSRAVAHCFLMEQTNEEAAAAIGAPLGTVKSRIRLALNQLRSLVRPGSA